MKKGLWYVAFACCFGLACVAGNKALTADAASNSGEINALKAEIGRLNLQLNQATHAATSQAATAGRDANQNSTTRIGPSEWAWVGVVFAVVASDLVQYFGLKRTIRNGHQ